MKPSEIAVKKDLDKFNCRVTIVFYVFLVVLLSLIHISEPTRLLSI